MPRDFLGWSQNEGGEWTFIEISKRIKIWPHLTRSVLLHEMVHVSLPLKILHGARFEKEMFRLAKAGAFKGLW
jgi:hypothetical protein